MPAQAQQEDAKRCGESKKRAGETENKLWTGHFFLSDSCDKKKWRKRQKHGA